MPREGRAGWLSCFRRAGKFYFFSIPLLTGWHWWMSEMSFGDWLVAEIKPGISWAYLTPCWCVAAATIIVWAKRQMFSPKLDAVLENHGTVVDIKTQLNCQLTSGLQARLLSLIP